jgi:hypothetical protein
MSKNLNKVTKQTEKNTDSSSANNETKKEIKKESKFWKNKPMMKHIDLYNKSSQITNLNEQKLYCNEKSNILPDKLDWNITEPNNDDGLNQICNFLNMYYKEENNIQFTVDFLKFVLGNDGFIMSIISKNSNIICGAVCVSIKRVVILDRNKNFAHANFLCSHPKFIKKGLVETLMNELIRYINVNKKIQQGFFITNNNISQPCATIRKYYRPINYHKLAKSDFLKLEGKENTIHNKFALSSIEESTNYISMQKEHVDKVYELYKIYTSQYNMSIYYTKDELENLLLNNNIVKSYVILSESSKEIIDFVSYYHIQYKCKNDELVNAGYLFLYSLLNEYSESMLNNLIKIMNKNDIDIIYVNDDKSIINTLLTEKYNSNEDSDIDTYDKIYEHKFIKKEKRHVYLFNWECPYLSSDKLNLDFVL